MSRFLVTGGAGFIGSHFVELALSKGHSVVVLDALTYAGHRENLNHLAGDCQLIHGDIADATLVAQTLKEGQIDAVFNLAAESHVDRSISGATPFIQTNVMGTFTLLNESLAHFRSLGAEKKSTFRYVQISTDEVFGDLGHEGHFTEVSPFQPHSPYSASKAAADHLVHAWHHTYDLPTLTTHCSNNYGPRQYPEKLIPYMIRCALAGKPMGIYGDGTNVRDWIHVQDHCQGIYLAWQKGRIGQRYCFGGGSERSNRQVVAQIVKSMDHLRGRSDGRSYIEQVTSVPDRLGHDRRYAIDDSVARNDLDFKRSIGNFDEALTETVKWYLANESWMTMILGRDS